MHCRLGSLPMGGLAELLEFDRRSARIPGPGIPGPGTGGRAPDLLGLLEPWHPDHGWVTAAAAATAKLGRGGRRQVTVTHCEFEPGPRGFIAIDVRCPDSRFEVREGDLLVGGFVLLRDGDASPQVLPRLYRLLCRNGSVHFSHSGAATAVRAATVDDAIHAALDHDIPRAAVRMAGAARTPVSDPLALLVRAGIDARLDAVLAAREDDDATLYGLVNTVTAYARGRAGFPARLGIEAAADRLLEVAARTSWPRGRHPAPRPRPAGRSAAASVAGG